MLRNLYWLTPTLNLSHCMKRLQSRIVLLCCHQWFFFTICDSKAPDKHLLQRLLKRYRSSIDWCGHLLRSGTEPLQQWLSYHCITWKGGAAIRGPVCVPEGNGCYPWCWTHLSTPKRRALIIKEVTAFPCTKFSRRALWMRLFNSINHSLTNYQRSYRAPP